MHMLMQGRRRRGWNWPLQSVRVKRRGVNDNDKEDDDDMRVARLSTIRIDSVNMEFSPVYDIVPGSD